MSRITSEPLSFTAGETVEWRKHIDDYPPREGWKLSYSFRESEAGFDVEATAKEDHYLVRLPSRLKASQLILILPASWYCIQP